ncbi:Transcriptional regulatory protein DegU [Streptomyces antimycoticus]
MTVMVVDDHPMWRDAVARDLAEAGFDVVATAGDGPQAVRRAKAAGPDVLVLDLNLPGLPGAEVCKEVLADRPELRVLVLSASGEHGDVLEAVKSGATGYLLKSASTEELLDAVRRTAAGDPVFTPGLAGLVLGEYRRPRASPPPPPPTSRPSRSSPSARRRCCGWWPRGCRTSRSPSGWSSRTARCRTMSRTPSANSSCTTEWSWSATPSSAVWTTPEAVRLRS